jgi:outer membrane protein assembly factor BamB
MRGSGAIATIAVLVLVSGLCPVRGEVALNWNISSGGHHIRCLGAIEDMNGDTRPDVLVEIDNTGDPVGHFRLLSGLNGSLIWGVSPPGGVSGGCGYGDSCVNTSPDLNGDGLTEALLGTAWGGRTAYAILADENGDVFWSLDTYTEDESGWVYSIDWIPDVTQDGVPDVVFGCGSYNDKAYCVDGTTGVPRWRFQAPDAVFSVARIGDVNGNGTPDVLVATGDPYADYTYCIDGGSVGYATYIWRFYVGDTSYSVTGIRDVDGDLIDDAVIGTWDSSGHVYCVSGATGLEIWRHPVGTYASIMRVVTTDDLNDDGCLEILVASWENAIICLDGRTGAEHWNVPTGTVNGGDVWAIWPLEDVDYDGYPDVIAGSFDLKAYCVSGRAGELLWTYTVGNRVYSVRGIGDTNDDGIGEALVGTQYQSGGGRVYCLDPDGEGTAAPPVEGIACSIVDQGVHVSWEHAGAKDLAGFNVYRADASEPSPPAEFRARAEADGADSVRDVLALRAAEGTRGGLTRLNEDLIRDHEFIDRSVVDGGRYAYVVGAVSLNGDEVLAGPVEIVADLRAGGLRLARPAPNPVRGGSRIEFAAPAGTRATLRIYDPAGRLVRELHSGVLAGGPTSVTWDGRSDSGDPVASGVYFVRLEAGGEVLTRKVAFVK